ncbi:MAG: hypothetical protein ACTSU7_00220 [Candidatus Heimdallarchaeaceae archaeon]
MYKALIEIGGYLPGQEVPTDLAETWLSMYTKAPVEKSESVAVKKVLKPEEPSNAMFDDYLGRNQNVVIKNVREDDLGTKVLSGLLSLEKKGKNRKPVIQAIKHKLRG